MKATLTGNRRYRIHKPFLCENLIVLQLEWKMTGVTRWSCDGGRVECDDLPDYNEWRDARVEDLTVENLI